MIKIVQNQDYEDVIVGMSLSEIKKITYYTHMMNPEDGIAPVIKVEDDKIVCKLFSDRLNKLHTGQLIRLIITQNVDPDYPDGELNEMKQKPLGVWIKGYEGGDTQTVSYGDLSAGLQQAIDLATTAVQPELLEDYVTVEDFSTFENNVYSKTETDELINEVKEEIPSLEGLATEQWVEDKGYLTEHQSLEGYLKNEVDDNTTVGVGDDPVAAVTFNESQVEIWGGDANFIRVTPEYIGIEADEIIIDSVAFTPKNYYTKTEIDVKLPEDVATKNYVDNKIGELDTILNEILA